MCLLYSGQCAVLMTLGIPIRAIRPLVDQNNPSVLDGVIEASSILGHDDTIWAKSRWQIRCNDWTDRRTRCHVGLGAPFCP